MNIYVGNLSVDVTEEGLRREFTAFGEVLSVTITNDRYMGSGQTKGYGFVGMASKSEGEAAVASLNGKRLTDRVIDVVEALPLSKSTTGIFHSRRDGRLNGKAGQRRH